MYEFFGRLSLFLILPVYFYYTSFVDIIDKAAQLCYALIQNHPFIDGNKRIGVHVMLIFLELNNQKMMYTQKELVDLGLGIASGEITRYKIKQWILSHTGNEGKRNRPMPNRFPEYTADYIAGIMSLRKPQKESLT